MANPLFGTKNYYSYTNPYLQNGVAATAATPPTYFQAANQTYPLRSPMTPIGQAIQSMTPQSNIIWIDNKDEIASYPTGRGWQQWFGDKNKPYLYVREMDMNGVIQPIRTVSFRIEDDSIPVQEEKAEVTKETSSSTSNGPSREEFEALSGSVKTIGDSVNMLVDKLGDLLK